MDFEPVPTVAFQAQVLHFFSHYQTLSEKARVRVLCVTRQHSHCSWRNQVKSGRLLISSRAIEWSLKELEATQMLLKNLFLLFN